MHAYIIVGESQETLIKAKEFAEKLNAKIMQFPLLKIADTRDLRNITKLSFNSPTAILINSIDEATEEAANAFLKNLEEPQENIFYILTASNLKSVLPTIISRCEIVKINSNKKYIEDGEIMSFLKLSTDKKLKTVDKIKDREEAKIFVQKIIENSHFNLLNQDGNKVKTVMDLEILIKTLNNLKLNGNVSLQLANMAINLN